MSQMKRHRTECVGPIHRASVSLPVESGHIALPAHQCIVYQPGGSTELWCPEFVSHVGMIDRIIGHVTELCPQPSFLTQKLGCQSLNVSEMIGLFDDQPPS